MKLIASLAVLLSSLINHNYKSEVIFFLILALKGLVPSVARSTAIQNQNANANGGARLLQTTPSAFDWRTYGAVTTVKNQASCGSCWAFAAAAFLEGEAIRRNSTTNTTNLSNQYLYWCTASGTYRCNGGDPFVATNYGVKRGMPKESVYPYKIGLNYGTICSAPIVAIKFNLTGKVSGNATWYYSSVNRSSNETITSYLLQRPLILGVDADDWGYYRPVLTDPIANKIFSCSTGNSGAGINHAVLLIGYTADAWIIKNSWGTGWGDKGFIYVTKNSSRSCGIGFYWGTLTSNLTRVV